MSTPSSLLPLDLIIAEQPSIQELQSGREHKKRPSLLDNTEFFSLFLQQLKQAQQHPVITTVYEKIGNPDKFRIERDIPDSEIGAAWNELLDHMNDRGVDLVHLSPRVTPRELYRFATEELFQLEFPDCAMPHVVSCFVYDEFHPDHHYRNILHARHCIATILSDKPIFWTPWLCRDNVQLNQFEQISRDEYVELVNDFKGTFNLISLKELRVLEYREEDGKTIIGGSYNVSLRTDGEVQVREDSWQVVFNYDSQSEDWMISQVRLHGIYF